MRAASSPKGELSGAAVRALLRLSRRAIELAFVAAVALVEAVGAALVIVASDHEPHKVADGALAVIAGLSFVFSGLIALHRRPENRTGLYLAAVGYLWFLGALADANNSTSSSRSAQCVGSLAFIPFAALILSFPTGRLDRAGRTIVRLTVWFVRHLAALAAPVRQARRRAAAAAARTARSSSTTRPALAHVARRRRRARPGRALRRPRSSSSSAAGARRRRRPGASCCPSTRAGGATLVCCSCSTTSLAQLAPGANAVLGPIFLVLFAAVPFAFLFGILRSRLARGSVAGLMVVARARAAAARRDRRRARRSVARARVLARGRRAAGSTATGGTLDLSHVPDQRDHGRRARRPAGRRAAPRRVARRTSPSWSRASRRRSRSRSTTSGSRPSCGCRTTFLTTIVDTAPSLLVTVDTDGRIRTPQPGHGRGERLRRRRGRCAASSSGTSSSTRTSARR